jgi:predicted DNA-binding protein (MmcQ/YjbR family)
MMNIEDLRSFCIALPHATEDIQWGNDLLFRVGNKIFAATGLDQTPLQISLKCTPEKFSELIEMDGIVPARYTARYHWVTVERTDALPRRELEDLIKKSYEMVLSKIPAKVKKQIGSRKDL